MYSVSYPSFDGIGNRTAKNDGTLTTYVYDNVYRLTSANPGEVFTYDNAGNRLTDAGNLYTINVGNTLAAKGSTVYTYDGFGNTITRGTQTFTWNSANQLTGFNGIATYQFDAFGRRISKTVNGVTTKFIYDGQDIIASITGGVITHYVHGSGVDEHLGFSRSGTSFFYHADGLGSITKITNSAQTVVLSYTYDSFGNSTVTGTVDQPYRFTGAFYDAESNTQQHRARTLDMSTGHWLSKDPIGFAGGDVVLSNYVGGNPVNYTDPSGLDETIWAPGEGRKRSDAPRNGNWCGGNWSGGWVPSLHKGQDGPLPPVDSLDACCMKHDKCYSANTTKPGIIACDEKLVSELQTLPSDPKTWDMPPRPGTENQSSAYITDAVATFMIKTQGVWKSIKFRNVK